MNNLKIFPLSILLIIETLLVNSAYALPASPPLPQSCYTEDSLRLLKTLAYMGDAAQKMLVVKPTEVVVKQTDEPSTSSTILNASESIVPSGNKSYEWGGVATDNQSIKKIKTPAQGSSTTIELRVRDIECNIERKTQITVGGK